MAVMAIRPFVPADEAAVVDLWRRCGLVVPQNDPHRDIARKLQVQPELFLVGEQDDTVVATAMASYDGHRGHVNYLAVEPALQGTGLGRALMAEVEARLLALGCPKLNLMVRTSNAGVLAFYERLGYRVDEVLCLGKRLVEDG